jgi:hypothetical protein
MDNFAYSASFIPIDPQVRVINLQDEFVINRSRLGVWDSLRRNKFSRGSIYFSSVTCYRYSIILRREHTVIEVSSF